MDYVKFVPPEGVRIPIEGSRRCIPPEGAVVPWNTFYRRRHKQDGGEVTPIPAESDPAPDEKIPDASASPKSRRTRRVPASEEE